MTGQMGAVREILTDETKYCVNACRRSARTSFTPWLRSCLNAEQSHAAMSISPDLKEMCAELIMFTDDGKTRPNYLFFR